MLRKDVFHIFLFQVSSIPTVIAVKNGKQVAQFIGLKEDDLIKKFVQDALEK